MILFFLSLLVFPAVAGDEMKEGTVLKQDSYVFSIDEAEKLKIRVEDLEKKEQLLEQYKILDSLKIQQTDLLKNSLDIKDGQINLYKEIILEKDDQLSLIKKKHNTQLLNNMVLFGAGVLFTGLSIYAADKLDDSIDN